MAEIERIKEQMKRAFEGNAWPGGALREALQGMTADEAARHPIANAHSIWELVLHVAAWKGVVRRRLEGETVQTPPEGDFPPVEETDEEAWQSALALLERRHRELAEKVDSLADSRLEEPISEGMSSVYVTLHGIIQHDLYHAAQIALLRKA